MSAKLRERLEDVRRRMSGAERRAGREPGSARLIAISKTFPAARVVEAAHAGVACFGENRVQEAEQKLPEVRGRFPQALEWHLVGQLQRNKARRAAELFDVIHSLDRAELAVALSRAAEEFGRCPRVLVQVNVDEEPQKGGCAPDAAGALVDEIDRLPALEAVGLMAIPRACEDAEQLRPSFVRLRELLEQLNRGRPAERVLRELSMGMSSDFEVAIEEGASWVRVGSAIFGEREAR